MITSTPTTKEMQVQVEGRTKAIKASYSIELAEKLKEMHGIDVETELYCILMHEMAVEYLKKEQYGAVIACCINIMKHKNNDTKRQDTGSTD